MTLRLSRADWQAIFPRAPAAIISAFTGGSSALDTAGITATRTRLAYALANVEHEGGGLRSRI
jgi:putative chitinase